MTVTRQRIGISAADLYAIVVDPTSYPNWLVGTKRIRTVSPNWPAEQSFFEHSVGFGPVVIPDTTSVREVEPPRLLELMVRARPVIEAVVRFEISPIVGGSEVTMTETPVGLHTLISPILEPLVRARNQRSLGRLRDFAENQPRSRVS